MEIKWHRPDGGTLIGPMSGGGVGPAAYPVRPLGRDVWDLD